MKSVTIIAFLWAAGGVIAESGTSGLRPLREGTELFVDDVQLASKSRVERTVHPARKLDHPVLVEANGAPARIYGTVLRDPATGVFRMWYGRRYATSTDGLHWEKPELEIYPVDGQPSNIVLPKGGGGVLFDEIESDASKRYKALLVEPIEVGGMSGYYSADGLQWSRYGDDRLLTVGSELAMVMRDPATRKYFAYVRPYPPKHFPKDVTEKRLGAVLTSDDFEHWSEMKVVLVPDAIDDAWVTSPGQRTEFYAMHGFAYGTSYLGVIPIFRIERIVEKTHPNQSRYDGPMEGQLVTSRDGLTWSRMGNRSPVIPCGTGFDQSIMNVASAPLIVDDEVWLYYTAISSTHGAPSPQKRLTIALARWRLDGFVSLDAGVVEGTVETVTRAPKQGAAGLEINADSARGFVSVEVLDAAGRVLPGYSRADCLRLEDDGIRHGVRWRDHDMLPSGIPYRLRFVFREASLYSFTVVAP